MKKVTMIAALLTITSLAQAANYKIDTDHSTIGFKVRHLIGNVSGRFDKYQGTFVYEKGNPKVWKAEATIEAASINTNVQKRDDHLRSADFLDVTKFPTITFVSTKVGDVSGNKAKLLGNLTIHGVTKPVVLDTEFLGDGKDPWGNEIASFVSNVTIDRKDYGLTWNQAVETGGVLVGDQVMITLEISGLKQK